MPIWIAVLLGIVQGLTEFLPISSSGHLAIVQSLISFGDYGVDQVVFNLVLHLGTLVAVVIAFWPDIKELVRNLFGLIFDGFKVKNKPYRRMIVMILVATVPLVIGALLEGVIKSTFENTLFIGCALMVTAVMLYLSDRIGGGEKDASNATYLDALKVGGMQLIALFPGISRSGATMSGGLLAGFKREFAVKFAFIMSIPAILGAAVFELPDAVRAGIVSADIPAYIIGFVVSAVSGYLAIRLVKTLMKKGGFKYFAIYCAAAGAITVVLTLTKII